jgi:hypothetical protein
LYVVAGIIGGCALVTAVVALLLFCPPVAAPGPRAINDQLALTDPNDQFADATSQRQRPDTPSTTSPVTRSTWTSTRLPSLGYGFVLLRSHSAWDRTEVEIELAPASADGEVGLFTNELYSNRSHLDDQYAAAPGRRLVHTTQQARALLRRRPEFTSPPALMGSSRAPWWC